MPLRLEPVHDLFSKIRIKAKFIMPRLEATNLSQFLYKRRDFSNQAKLLSTTQRLGTTLKLDTSPRLMTSTRA